MKLTKLQNDIRKAYGLKQETVYNRIVNMKWDVEKAITTPVRKKKFTDEEMKIAASNGVSLAALHSRVKNGWSRKEAINIPLNAHRMLTDEEIEIAASNGVSRETAYQRVTDYLWSIEEAITIPIDQAKTARRKHWSQIPQHLKETAAANGISLSTLHKRLYVYYWDEVRASTQPTRKRTLKLTDEQKRKAIQNNLKHSTIHGRISRGWTIEQAVSTPPQTRGNRKNA